MKLTIKAQVVLRDKNGKIIKIINKTLKSYVLGLVDILNGLFNATTYSSVISIKDTGDSARNFMTPLFVGNNASYFALVANATVSDDNFGIQVGNTASPITIVDNKLNSKILHGNTSTKLSYGACSIGGCATVGATRQFTMARTFTNNSGADITVNEVGLIVKDYYGTTVGYFMIEHSALTFTVANGTSGTVTYTISATV